MQGIVVCWSYILFQTKPAIPIVSNIAKIARKIPSFAANLPLFLVLSEMIPKIPPITAKIIGKSKKPPNTPSRLNSTLKNDIQFQ